MSDQVFINGMYVKQAKPDFVVCKLGFKVDDFVQFLQSKKKENGYVDVDVLLKKGGNGEMYGVLNAWVPDSQRSESLPPDIDDTDTPF